jgi:hypothetical protein
MPFDIRDALDEPVPVEEDSGGAMLGSRAVAAGWGAALGKLVLGEGGRGRGQLLEFSQGVDEVLFVPSGWWH